MDTVNLIIEAYTKIADGMKRVDLENNDNVIVKAYQVGKIIRIDIQENCDDAPKGQATKRTPRRIKIVR